MRLTEHAVALGRAGARERWKSVSVAERKEIMARVRAAKEHGDQQRRKAEPIVHRGER